MNTRTYLEGGAFGPQLRRRALAVCTALVFTPWAASEAEACGGTFCDTGPASMQVVPEFSVGSEALFENLLAATVPVYGYNTSFENCGDDDGGSGGNGDGDGDDDGGDGDGDGDGDPMVVFQDIVGAYEVTVLQGGTMSCGDDGFGNICSAHPLVEGLLAQYLPVPMGVDPGDFYSCMSCYVGLIDDTAWNAAEFGAAIDERVIQPGLHAQAPLDTWPYVTRDSVCAAHGRSSDALRLDCRLSIARLLQDDSRRLAQPSRA